MIKVFVRKISENILLSTTYFLIALLAVGGFFYYKILNTNYVLENALMEANAKLKTYEDGVKTLAKQNEELSGTLESKKTEINSLTNEVGGLSSKVGMFEKLAKNDKELLEKYSKVFFLNEHYIPKELSEVPESLLVSKDKTIKIASNVLPFLKRMDERAKEDGINLKVVSGYRSFSEQSSLKSSYKVTYGSGANKFSADQGYSEHQLGTTIDFSNDKLGTNFTAFESTNAYIWLTNHAHKFGFILSYPKNNAYYQFEPWHWRFVGEALATKLHNYNKNFYDMDQREINEYLINMFDY